MRKFIRIYTPFMLSLTALVNTIFFIANVYEPLLIYSFASIGGGSVFVDIYMFCTSSRMCCWYKANIVCLGLIHTSGLFYNAFDIDEALYSHAVLSLSIIGIISFIIFRIKYKVCAV